MMRRQRRFHRCTSRARPHARELGWIDPRAVEPPKLDRDRADELREYRKCKSSPDGDSGCA